MNIYELREKVLAAVDAATFESELPAGECDNATTVKFLKQRQVEIVAVVRRALGNSVLTFTSDEILRFLYNPKSLPPGRILDMTPLSVHKDTSI